MYVQYQVPVAHSHLPVVMVHGGGLSGQAYDTTPDGRMGWSEYFVRAGRPVYVVDQAGRGRSGFNGTPYNAVKLGTAKEQPAIQIIGHEYAWTWFRIGPAVGIPFPDTQFPVEAIDAFDKMWIPDLNAALIGTKLAEVEPPPFLFQRRFARLPVSRADGPAQRGVQPCQIST